MTTYSHEDRARARGAVRQLNELAATAQTTAARGLILPADQQQAIVSLTGTEDINRQIDALISVSERLRNDHLKKLREIAKHHFGAFCEYINPDEPPESKWHIWLTDELLQKVETDPLYQNIVLNCPPGHAKDILPTTRIFTPNGWTTIGEIQVGDELYDETGAVCRVTWKSPIYVDQEVYRVTTDCGDEIVCGAGHEWPVVLDRKPQRPATKRGRYKKSNPHPYTIKTAKELARRRAKKPMIARAGILQLPHHELPLDPYVLGVWLGDGSTGAGVITQHPDDAVWLKEEFARLGYELRSYADPQRYGIPGLMTKLRAIGILNDKSIPRDYILSSPEQRLSLLQGLIDTDGTVSPEGQVVFCNKNRDLIDEVQFLVRSLGVKATVGESRAVLNGEDYGPVWRVSFYKKDAARMPRKRALCRDAERTPNTYITVEPAGRGDTQCIEVDSPNHLFLCGKSMTPTHNPLAGDTLVLMGSGDLKRLDQIQVGDTVITHQGRARPVTAVHVQGRLPCLKIVTKGGRVVTSALPHPFMLEDGTYKQASDLRPNDALAFGVLTEEIGVEDRSTGWFELAAYFGALGGRTYHMDRKKTKYYRNVFLWTGDLGTHHQMTDCLKAVNIAHETWQNKNDGFNFIRINTGIGDEMAEPFFIDAPSTEREIPAFVFQGAAHQIKRFVSVFFTERGVIGKKFLHPRLTVEIRSRVYAQQVQSLLARFGVPCQYVETGTKTQTAKLILTAPDLEAYLAAGFTFDGGTVDRIATKRNVEAYGTATPSDPVYLVKPLDEPEECFCLTVEDDHTFIANDVIVHNSTYASRLFIAWRMGRRPDQIVIGGGHTQTFVENEFSKKIRDIVGSPSYKDIFPDINISTSTRGAGQWELAGRKGKYVARGAGQGVHGFRANFICVDDPYSKVEEADSPAARQKVKDWFFTDLGSRLLPNGTQFVIMTRFHEDDLTGSIIAVNKLLPEEEQYRIVEVPGICYDPENDLLKRRLGEVLWDYYKISHYTNLRAKWKYQKFALIIQQNADATDEKSVASKLKFYKSPPHLSADAIRQAKENNQRDDAGRLKINLRDWYRKIIVSVDTASTKTERADYTVVQVWGVAHDHHYYLLDQSRQKVHFNEMVSLIERPARRWGADAILVEDKGAGNSYLQHRGSTESQRRQAPCPLVAIKVDAKQGKEFRFDEISPIIEAGEVHVPEAAEWTDLFVRELGQFPEGAHDDQVDSMSQALRYLKSKRKSKYGTREIGSMG